MKQTFNLLSEVLALPFSELFLSRDLLAECIDALWIGGRRQSDRISELGKRIDELGAQAAGYINLHTTLLNTSVLQNMVNYVYREEDIAKIAAEHPELNTSRAVANYYYTSQMKRIAKTFLTTRNGRAAFKYWPGSSEAYSHMKWHLSNSDGADWNQDLLGPKLGTHRIEAWHSLLQCLPESFLISSYAACLAESSPPAERQETCFRTLLHFGRSVQIADILLDKVLDQGLAETHLHAAASRPFDLIWEDILGAAVEDAEVLQRDYRPVFQAEITKTESAERAREALITRTLLAAHLRWGTGNLQEFVQRRPAGPGPRRLGTRYQASFSRTMAGLALEGRAAETFSSAVPRIKIFLQDFCGHRHHRYLPDILGIPEHIYTADIGYAERCFMAWSLLHIVEFPGDVCFSAVFLYYLRQKNYFYRCRTQDSKSKGLPYFKDFFAQSTDSKGQTAERLVTNVIYTALLDRRIVKTEFRLSPPQCNKKNLKHMQRDMQRSIKKQLKRFIRQHIYTIATLYGDCELRSGNQWEDTNFWRWWQGVEQNVRHGRRGELKRLLECFHVSVSQVRPHRIGIVYHFIKQGEKFEDRSCFVSRRGATELDQYGIFSFGRTRFRCEAAVNAISAVRRISPEMSRLIVGIDAASQELPTEPWVFAPAFRLAREMDLVPFCGVASQDESAKKLTLGITFHVGEEFRHPLSGLRHISEATEFYKMHSGDRLGHALALGIDFRQWFRQHGLVTMPQIEWMEDCLWAWEIISQNPTVTDLSEYSKYLETQIMSCANEIYGTLNGISIEKLCCAYRNKTLGYHALSRLSEQWAVKYQPCEIDCSEYMDSLGFFPCTQNTQAFEFGWSEDALTLSYHCGYYKNRMNKEIIRNPDLQEFALIQDLQIYLRNKIAKSGIILEENPSSNATIGEINGILSHPIYDLRIARDSVDAVITTVNTDDPSVFNTNIANEHALIYFALIHRGCSVEEALKITDELRKAGLNGSFICDPPPFEHLLLEYEAVLQIIANLD